MSGGGPPDHRRHSHGRSDIGFGVTRLRNPDLLPRTKRINKVVSAVRPSSPAMHGVSISKVTSVST